MSNIIEKIKNQIKEKCISNLSISKEMYDKDNGYENAVCFSANEIFKIIDKEAAKSVLVTNVENNDLISRKKLIEDFEQLNDVKDRYIHVKIDDVRMVIHNQPTLDNLIVRSAEEIATKLAVLDDCCGCPNEYKEDVDCSDCTKSWLDWLAGKESK